MNSAVIIGTGHRELFGSAALANIPMRMAERKCLKKSLIFLSGLLAKCQFVPFPGWVLPTLSLGKHEIPAGAKHRPVSKIALFQPHGVRLNRLRN